MTKELTFESAFTEAEHAVIQQCEEKGQWESIIPALETHCMTELTQEKVRLLDEHLKSVRPVAFDETSEVRAELARKEMQEGYRIETKEDQEMWQKRIDEEREAKEKAFRGDTTKVTDGTLTEESLAKAEKILAPSNDLPSEVEMTRAEIMDALKSRGVAFKATASKAELSDALEAAIKTESVV